MLKFLFILFCVTLTRSNVVDLLNSKQIQALGNLVESQLPESMRRHIRSVTLQGSQTQNWCCAVPTYKTIHASHSQMFYISKQNDKVSYHSCGFLWTSRCSRHSITYSRAPQYKAVHTYRRVKIHCPDSQVKCCSGYLNVANNCLPASEIHPIINDLKNLSTLGILG